MGNLYRRPNNMKIDTNEYEDDPDKYGNCPCYTCQTGDY